MTVLLFCILGSIFSGNHRGQVCTNTTSLRFLLKAKFYWFVRFEYLNGCYSTLSKTCRRLFTLACRSWRLVEYYSEYRCCVCSPFAHIFLLGFSLSYDHPMVELEHESSFLFYTHLIPYPPSTKSYEKSALLKKRGNVKEKIRVKWVEDHAFQ